jgi:uncharacterized membrane-anchored protein YitT (DUF2179 family)
MFLAKSRNLKNIFYITLGSLLIAISIALFYSSGEIAVGGPVGIAVILKKLLGIEVSASYFWINCFILVAGGKCFGVSFIYKSMYSVVLVSSFIYLLPSFIWIFNIWTLIVSSVGGGFLFGLGIALVSNGAASPGAWTTVARLIASYFNFRLASVIWSLDFLVIVCLYYVTNDIMSVIFGVLSLLVCTLTINRVESGGHVLATPKQY